MVAASASVKLDSQLMIDQQPIQKIALVLPDLRGGGVEKVCSVSAHEFVSRGYDVDVVLMESMGELLSELPEQANVVDLKAKRMRNIPRAFARYLIDAKPDVVLAKMWPLTSMCAIGRRLARSRTRLVVSDHSMLSHSYAHRGKLHEWAMRASLAVTYRMVDARIGVSQGVVDEVARLSGIDRQQFQVIYNPIAKEFFEPTLPADRLDSLWGDKTSKRIISVGSFKPVKNFELLIRAFAKVVETIDARLVLLGEGAQRAQIESTAKSLGVYDRVLMPGFAKDPTPYYASADLFVLSSNHEGFGNVIVEALAIGLPVVSTDCPSGPAEILENGKHGRLVPVGDEDALSVAIEDVLARDHDKKPLQKRANEFSPAIVSDEYLKVLVNKTIQ